MGKVKRFIFIWGPALAWMGTIFYLSSRQSVTITHTYIYDFLIFKLLHMIEYAILYFLVFRGLYLTPVKKSSFDNKLLWAVLFSVLYALSDEIHQTLTPTRNGRIRDLIFDTAGIVLMYIYIKSNLKFIKRFF